MTSPWVAAGPLLNPLESVETAVEGRRWVWPLLAVMTCATFSAVAVHARRDASPKVMAELAASGELPRLTEQEISDKIELAGRIDLVAGIARGLLGMPLAAVL